MGNFIIPTDELIFFRGVGSTTNQLHVKKVDEEEFENVLREASNAKWMRGETRGEGARLRAP